MTVGLTALLTGEVGVKDGVLHPGCLVMDGWGEYS